MEKYIKQTKPFVVPTIDGKLIEEHFGVPSTNHRDFSLAHLIAPSGWSEPFQTPAFDEILIMISGKKMIEIDGEKIILNPGESLLVKKNTKVMYSNPFDEKAEYWSVCLPAFTIEGVNREE
jgi:mannose-6-phosphate isomerase-like protein (cupin superfamily)